MSSQSIGWCGLSPPRLGPSPAMRPPLRSDWPPQSKYVSWRNSMLCRFRLTVMSGPSTSEIIAHYQAEDEPSGADRALQRTADLRFSDTRVVAHRDFNHAESSEGAFEDHLNRPAIGGLFEGERA